MRLAVAGLGFIGSVHLKAIRSIPDVQLAAVVSRNEAKLGGDLSRSQGNLAAAGAHFDFSQIKKYREIREALNDPEIDAVDLCIPTDLHEHAAIAALRAGKHVLVEKPMALTTAGCERMMEEARRAGRMLMAAHVLRFFPAYTVLIRAMKDLGEPRSATFRRRCARPTWGDPSRSGGAVLDLLIHDLDFALHLFGAPESVAATGRVEDDIDIASAQLIYPRFMVDVTGGWHPGKFPLSMKYRVTGSNASVDFNFNQHPPRMHRDGMVCDLPLDSADGFAAEVAYFAGCVRSGSPPDRCPPEESADAVRLALLVMESRKRGGERIEWRSE